MIPVFLGFLPFSVSPTRLAVNKFLSLVCGSWVRSPWWPQLAPVCIFPRRYFPVEYAFDVRFSSNIFVVEESSRLWKIDMIWPIPSSALNYVSPISDLAWKFAFYRITVTLLFWKPNFERIVFQFGKWLECFLLHFSPPDGARACLCSTHRCVRYFCPRLACCFFSSIRKARWLHTNHRIKCLHQLPRTNGSLSNKSISFYPPQNVVLYHQIEILVIIIRLTVLCIFFYSVFSLQWL